MNQVHQDQERRIDVKEVSAAAPVPRARVDDAVDDAPPPAESAANKLARKRDYLAGFLAETPADPAPGDDLHTAIVDALKDIFDPEIPVNIYDLGLIYNVEIDEGHVVVTMTLTTPHCPVAESMPAEVELRVAAVPGVGDVTLNLVWDPPWSPANMSDEARLELGML